jgi:hypothetical protein
MYFGLSRSLKRINAWRIGFGFRLSWWNILFLGSYLLLFYSLKYSLLLCGWLLYLSIWLPMKLYYWLFKGTIAVGKIAVDAGKQTAARSLEVSTETEHLEGSNIPVPFRKPKALAMPFFLISVVAASRTAWVLMDGMNGAFYAGLILTLLPFFIGSSIQGGDLKRDPVIQIAGSVAIICFVVTCFIH